MFDDFNKRPLSGFSGPNYFYYNLGTRSPTSPTHCTLDLLTMSLPWSSIDSILFEIFSLSSTLGHHEQFQPAVTPLMRDMEIFTAGHQWQRLTGDLDFGSSHQYRKKFNNFLSLLTLDTKFSKYIYSILQYHIITLKVYIDV